MKNPNLDMNRTINFPELINLLKDKIMIELHELEQKNNKNEKKLKLNHSLSKVLESFDIVTIITTGGIILGIFGGTYLLLKQSYDFYYNIINNVDLRDFMSTATFIAGLGNGGLGIAAVCNANVIFETVSSIYDTIIVNPCETLLSNIKKRNFKHIKGTNQKISYLNSALRSLDEMKVNFPYLIHSKLKDKLFTEKEVNLIYKYLTSSNITALIYLLYHDRISDIKHMNPDEKEQLTSNLKSKIDKIKQYSEQLKLEQAQQAQKSDEIKRHRRFEKFHTYPHDSMIEETYANLDSTSAKKGRK